MKRIMISLLLLAAMLCGMMTAQAAEAEITVQVRASKTEVRVGDTVEYTVLATGSGVVAMQFNLQLPEGLTYVPNSAKTPENLAQKLGVPAADWTEQSMMFTFYNDIGITFAKGTEILRFSCVAEKEGAWNVELYELLPFDGEFMEFTPKLQVQTVNVTGDTPVIGETAPVIPEQLPQQTEPAVEEPQQTQPTQATEPPVTDATEPPVTDTTEPTSQPDETETTGQAPQEQEPQTPPEQEVPAVELKPAKSSAWKVILLSAVGVAAVAAAIWCIKNGKKKKAA